MGDQRRNPEKGLYLSLWVDSRMCPKKDKEGIWFKSGRARRVTTWTKSQKSLPEREKHAGRPVRSTWRFACRLRVWGRGVDRSEAGSVAGKVYVTYLCSIKVWELLWDWSATSPSSFSIYSPKKIPDIASAEKRAIPLSSSDPILSNTSYCLNHFCHSSKVSQNLRLFNKMLIYASGKRTEKYISSGDLFFLLDLISAWKME